MVHYCHYPCFPNTRYVDVAKRIIEVRAIHEFEHASEDEHLRYLAVATAS